MARYDPNHEDPTRIRAYANSGWVDAPDHGRVRPLIRAILVDLATRNVVAEAAFRTQRPAAQNAAGAAAALAEASHELSTMCSTGSPKT